MSILYRCVIAFRFGCYSALFFRELIAFDAMVLKIDAIESVGQRLQSVVPCCRLQVTFPHRDAVPAHCGKLLQLFLVASAVTLYLSCPVLCVALRYNEVFAAFVPMPKAAINKDDCAEFAEDNVRMPRQTWVVQPIAIPSAEQELPHKHLRFGVLSSYRSHTMMAPLLGQFVHCTTL